MIFDIPDPVVIENRLKKLTDALKSVDLEMFNVNIKSQDILLGIDIQGDAIGFTGTPDSPPPAGGVVILGYDGSYVRRIKTNSAGELMIHNIDTALSTRASEATLNSIRIQIDKLQFNANNFLRIALASDEVGIAKETTLLNFRDLMKPVTKTNLTNVAVSANTNILTTDLSPINTPCIFRIYVVPTGFETPPVFSVIRKKGTTEIAEKMNNGNALNNDCGYMFDILVDSGEVINFQVDQDGMIAKLIVVEYYLSP